MSTLKRAEARVPTSASRVAAAQGRLCKPLLKIISGGQTGADRAALAWALGRGIPHGGWCPKGRRSENGMIPKRYRLRETPSPSYAQRTAWNVRDADGTVVLSLRPKLTGGSRKTIELARQLARPCLHLAAALHGMAAAARLRAFIRTHRIRVLNVVGPRVSEERGVGGFVRRVLEAALGRGAAQFQLCRWRGAPLT